jgi:predicted unusual protein kinase regulating ubiquinone biosynthesis (AarF/ABC1/UbiB family)
MLKRIRFLNFLWQSSGLRLHVNIGDVDITPSREALSYTPQTKENIRNLLQKVMEDIKDTVEDSIKGQPTLFLARKKYVEVEEQCHSIKSAMESLNQAIEWNGQKIFDSMVGNKIKVEHLDLKQMMKSGWRRKAETKRWRRVPNIQ